MSCLERRRQEAATLVGILATADAAMVSRAVGAVAGLTDVATCADVAALQRVRELLRIGRAELDLTATCLRA